MEVYANNCMKSQVCKLFAPIDGAVTQDISVMPYKKLKVILSNYKQVIKSNTNSSIFGPIK